MSERLSLFGSEVDDLLVEISKNSTSSLLKKIKSPKTETKSTEQQLKSKKISLVERLQLIKEHVEENLGMHRKDIQVIYTKEDLVSFIDKSIINGVLAYDTETDNSLDYLTCKIVGMCLYTPGCKAAYVPIWHTNWENDMPLEKQVDIETCKQQLKRLIDNNVKIIMHNGKFDYQVTKCFLGVELPIYWDTMVACRIINENDEYASLKWQYKDKIDHNHPDYDIDKMFPGIKYTYVDPELFALYAATDALMTYELYLWQKNVLNKFDEQRVLRLFMEVEMPLVIPVAEMELRGVLYDSVYSDRLQNKYHNEINHYDELINKELDGYKTKIAEWRLTPDAMYKEERVGKDGAVTYGKSKSEQLEDPINFDSPSQLAILLYDVIGVKPANPKKPRTVDKKALPIIAQRDNIKLCKLLIERKKIKTLLTDFIDKLPTLVNSVDGAIHCSFNQCGKEDNGVVTGRFSSSNPNLQQIPSHDTSIRPVFMARPNYVLVGGDFSAQEPRLTAYYSQDENMLNAYKEGKDLYAVIASAAFDNKYEDNLEFYPEGTEIEFEGQRVICGHKTHTNDAGKARRSQAKSILLGILYGRGAASVGEQIGKTKEEAQKIIDKFFDSFPKVREWVESTHDKARKLGYVEDWFGRKRHLPDINLPRYDVKYKDGRQIGTYTFNPILGCKGRLIEDSEAKKWIKLCNDSRGKADLEDTIQKAAVHGLVITDNTGIIAKAERQSVNSIVQGGAATLTKMAMVNLYNDPILRELDFHMIITVHDEVLGECPKENANKVADRMAQVMIDTSKPYMNVPMSVDCEVGSKWYINNYITSINEEYKKLISGDKKKNILPISKEEAFEKIVASHTECLREELHDMLYNNSEVN